MFAHLVDGDDAGVVKLGHGLGLVLEAAEVDIVGEHSGLDHLQGHQTVEGHLAGTVHDPHAAPAQLLVDLVIAEVANTITALQPVSGRTSGLSDGCVHGSRFCARTSSLVASTPAPPPASVGAGSAVAGGWPLPARSARRWQARLSDRGRHAPAREHAATRQHAASARHLLDRPRQGMPSGPPQAPGRAQRRRSL